MAEKPEENKPKKERTPFKQRFSAKKIGVAIKRYGTSVYLILAFCLVAAVTLSVLTINMNYSEIEDDVRIPEIIIPTLPDNADSMPTGKSVNSTPTGVDSKISETQPPQKQAETTKAAISFAPPSNGKISKKFSAEALVFSTTLKDYRTHSGIDIEAAEGTPVLAYSSGTITAIEDTPMMGKAVTISHQFGLTSVYMNLAEELPAGIKVGASVNAGEKIGKIGRTSIAEIGENPHLHFELKLNGVNIDPEKELESIG